ncbi:hypothetical protein SAMD00023353_0802710 [Rosellinia necatrix]|uniref:Uncharacterized protein n=1 Tax=Rosellinia necatrix TaxID=77044 RepID=A0A1W2TBC6_ROSNE|nr:hypothetical protein SAMD00023353_0802710 [Rosellinia necatrix]
MVERVSITCTDDIARPTMESSPYPEASWRTSTVYTRIFRRRPEGRKVRERSSLPDPESALARAEPPSASASAPTSGHRVSSQAPTTRYGREEFVPPAHHAFRAQAVSSNPNISPVHHHQRSRSASAAFYRPGYEDNLLKPFPLRPPVTGHHPRTPVHGPRSSAYYSEPYSRHGFPGADSAVGMNRSAYDMTGPPHAQNAQRSSKMSSAMMGNYAQIDPKPTTYQRRGSTSSSVTSSIGSKDTFDAILASPASSMTSFDSWQSTSRKLDHGWQRPTPIKQYRRRREQGELFAALPEEVLSLILQRLKKSHLKAGTASCATCMMRDLCSVAASAKKLLKVARVALYEDIQLIGADSQTQKKRLKISYGSRLVLLRRTLRSNPGIAILVRSLKAPAVPQGVQVDLYQNLIASVIMACPNFERLVGPHQNYDFSFSRLFHALSTREQLREIHWTLEAPKTQQRKRGMSNATPMRNTGTPDYHEASGDLRPDQSTEFRELHTNWVNLTTLSIHCLPGATLTPVSLLPGILADVSSLQHLHLSHLPFMAFNDANLLSLPALHTLTLSHLPGISSTGLSSFARRPSSRSIRKLTLLHLDIDSLPAIAQVLSHLSSLETFTLVQTLTPILTEGEMIWLFPYLASATLTKLHWDIPSFATTANIADSILAKSIVAHGFPALHTLRAPADPEGLFQNLCKPIERVDLATDRYRGLIAKAGSSRPKSPPATPTTPRTPRTPGSDTTKSPFGLKFPMDDQLFPSKVSSNLTSARLEAQHRLEAAHDEPRFTFNLVDEGGRIIETKKMAGFMGTIGSRINYCLMPDIGAADENGGLVEISDVLGDGGENLKDGNREGCTGRWNTYSGAVIDKKDRERWWHTERGRWRSVEL